jgi:hypothetical protein
MKAIYTTVLRKFNEQGEKTGWTYLEVPREQAEKIKPGVKTSYRVKGKLDNHRIEKTSLLPMGEGDFIIPFNAILRKALGKTKGDKIEVTLEADDRSLNLDKDFLQCLKDDPDALSHFNTLPGSHRNYFNKWIQGAKTDNTRASRIARAVSALSLKLGYAEMIRMGKKDKLF